MAVNAACLEAWLFTITLCAEAAIVDKAFVTSPINAVLSVAFTDWMAWFNWSNPAANWETWLLFCADASNWLDNCWIPWFNCWTPFRKVSDWPANWLAPEDKLSTPEVYAWTPLDNWFNPESSFTTPPAYAWTPSFNCWIPDANSGVLEDNWFKPLSNWDTAPVYVTNPLWNVSTPASIFFTASV